MWRLLILAVALVLGLLVAVGETGRWDLILRFIYQSPYGRNDPLFDKDIGFYLFSLPVYVAVKKAPPSGSAYGGSIALDRLGFMIKRYKLILGLHSSNDRVI